MRNVVLVSLIIFLSCIGDTDKEKSKNVILIFNNCPEDIHKIYNPEFPALNQIQPKEEYEISFYDGNYEYQHYQIQKGQLDTLIIPVLTDDIEIMFRFGITNQFYYFLHAGDTVMFNFDNGIPHAALINTTNKRFLNYDKLVHEKIYGNRIHSAIKYTNPFLFHEEVRTSANPLKTSDSIKSLYIAVISNEYEKIYTLTDLLYSVHHLSENEYKYRKNNLIARINNSLKTDDRFHAPLLNSYLADTVYFNNDSLLRYFYYRSYVSTKVNQYLKHLPYIVESNSRYPNYAAQFDTISRLDFLSEKERNYVLKPLIKNMAEKYSSLTLKNYMDKYTVITGDTVTVNNIINDYKLNFSSAGKLMLQTAEGYNTDLQTVLTEHRGKMIYVDFWASWCVPCRRTMPATLELQKEYSGKDIVFIFLAYNDEKEAWQKAMDYFDLNGSESYLITNTKTSNIISDLKVNSIPRYLLYNKNGELIDAYAPAAGDELRKIIDNYLKKN